MEPIVADVETLKKKARKLAAGKVLAGGGADVSVPIGRMEGCQVRIAAGYGALSDEPQVVAWDRLLWILDGYADVESAEGQVTRVSQGESTILAAGSAFRLVFPTLTVYLRVESGSTD